MKKLTLFAFLFWLVVLSWCSMSNLTWSSNGTWKNTESKTCSITSNSCWTETWTKIWTKTWTNYKILSWEYTWNQENMSKLIKIFDDLNVIDNSYWYLTKQAWKQQLKLTNGDELSIKSGNVFLKKDWKDRMIFPKSKEKNDDLWWVLGLDEKVVALFWPYENVFESGDISFVYATKSPYWETLQQHLYSISKWKNIKSDVLLYHNKSNDTIVWTTKSEKNTQYMHKDIIIYKNWKKSLMLTWWIDSVFYNWNNVYISNNDSSDELSDVYEIDLWNLTSNKILSKKNIWHEWKFFVSNWMIYVSFWVIDFVNDNVSHHISAYDESDWKLLWEAEIE